MNIKRLDLDLLFCIWELIQICLSKWELKNQCSVFQFFKKILSCKNLNTIYSQLLLHTLEISTGLSKIRLITMHIYSFGCPYFQPVLSSKTLKYAFQRHNFRSCHLNKFSVFPLSVFTLKATISLNSKHANEVLA